MANNTKRHLYDPKLSGSHGGTYQPLDSSVSRVASGIIASGSPLMRQAAARGRATASSRGLLNSSIAAGASQDAVLGRAGAMASQTAGQNFEQNLAYQRMRGDLLGQTSAANIASRRLTQEERIEKRRMGREGAIASGARTQEERIEKRRMNRQAGFDRQERMSSSILGFEGVFQQAQNTINANQDIPAEARESLLADLSRRRNSNIRLMEQIYGIKLKWN